MSRNTAEPGFSARRVWRAFCRLLIRAFDRLGGGVAGLGRRIGQTQTSDVKFTLVVSFLVGLALAAGSQLVPYQELDNKPVEEASVVEGMASVEKSGPSTSFVWNVPTNRSRFDIELQLEEGATATASVVVLNASNAATTREIKLEKGKWVAWSSTGLCHRILVDLRPSGPAATETLKAKVRISAR